jgi:predicted nucleotide-binding protein
LIRDLRKVFVVHGHDHVSRDELRKIISSLGLRAVVLSDIVSGSSTIIEKFEAAALESEFAFVLLTPDDKTAGRLPARQKFRARQNVIFEMGWFFAKLGRTRVVLLHRGPVEIPSDVTGVEYVEFKISVSEVQNRIVEALEYGGVL